ncbi:hypothetical protein [Chroococcidiopsis sp. CCMEE 29]|uniref:hypothetical protein n=1 Tax=Chroococcidiopsis sp. CCMEE 29 TaxID=155894 RepID=UPI002021F404|nr:hypothetical protein [Chroococcidiopsis sp. CCMEE 29]
MSKNLLFNQGQLGLPNIGSIERSEQAFADAFLSAAKILCKHLTQITSAIEVIEDFTSEPFNLAILGLFSKMRCNYYSYVLLEIHHDQLGSQFLIEHLCEAAITLTYLVEEADRSIFSEYISASECQAHSLLNDVKEQLQKFPTHSELLILREKLNTFITKQQNHTTEFSLGPNPEVCLWEPQGAETTAKRGAIVGLNFLTNPARQIALRAVPASWLDLQLNYVSSFAKISFIKGQSEINFRYLRDAAHICLHATQSFLEEVDQHQNIKLHNIEHQQQILNMLYEWFYNAHQCYQLPCCATAHEQRDNRIKQYKGRHE